MFYKGERMEGRGAPSTDFHGYGEAIRREVGRRLASGRKVRVLDVGTGFGANAAFLAGHLSRSSEIWTVDPSDEVLANARAALADEDAGRVRFVRASADRLEFRSGFFDAVVSVMAMHHIEDAPASVAELARVLRKGGKLLIVDYKPEAAGRLEFHSRHAKSDFFTPETIRDAAERAGLKSRVEDFGLWYMVEAGR